MTDHAHAADHEHHAPPGVGKYLAVFLALCVLTSASFFTYSDAWPFHDTPAVGWTFMMAVSCTKALLVILFFMHLKWEANWKWVLTIPATMMSIFLLLALVPDIGLRMRRYSEERAVRAAEVPGASGAPAADHAAGADDHGEDHADH